MRTLAMVAVAAACASAHADYNRVEWARGEIWRLDETTGDAVQVGELGGFWRANSMARSPDGRYFVAAEILNQSNEYLFEINPHTGAATQLFATGLSDIRSMAFAPDGTLYATQYDGVSNSMLWSIDVDEQTVSNPTLLFGVGAGVSPGLQGLAIDDQGQGYMGGPGSQLRRVNIQTGAVSAIAPVGPRVGVQSLAFNDAGELVGFGRNSGDPGTYIYTFDTSDATVAITQTFDLTLDLRGMEWIVPAPGVPGCLALGCVWMTRRRRA